MVLRMRKILILWEFTKKSDFQRGVHGNIQGRLPKKSGGLGQFADLKGGLAKKKRGGQPRNISSNSGKTSLMKKSSVDTTQKRFSIKDFFSKCDQIRKRQRIW